MAGGPSILSVISVKSATCLVDTEWDYQIALGWFRTDRPQTEVFVMQGVPVPRDELPAEVWQLLPANCTIRHDEEFLYLYQFEVLVLALNKRADGAALARILRIGEQLWPGLGSTMLLTLARGQQRSSRPIIPGRDSSQSAYHLN